MSTPPVPQITTTERAPAGQRLSSGRCLRLSGVAWQTYSRLLRIFAERPGVRLTYDRGELEIMSPLLEHDNDRQFLGRLIIALTEELDLPLKGGGSTTLRKRRPRRGLEADDCYWIASAGKMTGKRRLDLRTDPPPDLAMEVDVTRSSLDRMGIYAKLGVPEVWRLERDNLKFLLLGSDGKYTVATASRSFPLVTAVDLLGYLQQARRAGDDNPIVRQFRAWVRQRRVGQPSSGPLGE